MIRLTREPIETKRLIPQIAAPHSGATVAFVGTARKFTGGQQTSRLEYDAYPEMALKTMRALEAEARDAWPILDLEIVHRLGPIELGEACVALVVSCPHRREAFTAAAWLMDRIKQVVPIWKKEYWSDGTSQWIHPAKTVTTEDVG